MVPCRFTASATPCTITTSTGRQSNPICSTAAKAWSDKSTPTKIFMVASDHSEQRMRRASVPFLVLTCDCHEAIGICRAEPVTSRTESLMRSCGFGSQVPPFLGDRCTSPHPGGILECQDVMAHLSHLTRSYEEGDENLRSTLTCSAGFKYSTTSRSST